MGTVTLLSPARLRVGDARTNGGLVNAETRGFTDCWATARCPFRASIEGHAASGRANEVRSKTRVVPVAASTTTASSRALLDRLFRHLPQPAVEDRWLGARCARCCERWRTRGRLGKGRSQASRRRHAATESTAT